jgi:acetyl esterase/lipase
MATAALVGKRNGARQRVIGLVLSTCMLLVARPSAAVQVRLTIGDLTQMLQQYNAASDPEQNALARDVQERLAAKGIQLSADGLLASGTLAPRRIEARKCDDITGTMPRYVELLSGEWSVAVPDRGTLLDLHAGGGRLGFEAAVSGVGTARASLAVDWNVRNGTVVGGAIGGWIGAAIGSTFGGCSHVNTDHVSVEATVQSFSVRTALDVDLTTERRDGRFFIVVGKNADQNWAPFTATPQIRLDLRSHDSVLSPLYDRLLDTYEEQLTADVETKVKAAEDRVNARIRLEVSENGGALAEYEIDASEDEIVATVLDFAGTPAFEPYVRKNANEIAFLLLANDTAALKNMLLSSAACELESSSFAKMNLPPLYTRVGSQCRSADVLGSDAGAYFSDASCTLQVSFRPSSSAEYCREMLAVGGNTILGDAARWTPDRDQVADPVPTAPSRRWTVSPGTMLNIGLEPLEPRRAPFMKRVSFRRVSRAANGKACDLEMRVYKRDINAKGLRPLLAIHGGGWSLRSPFFGLEAQLAHYTDAGFLVFAPFYRLSGHDDGSPECQNASPDEILSDVEAALDWVNLYGDAYGADGSKPVVMGQSAGAHLAASLIVRRPADVGRGLLLYAPTDARSYLEDLASQGFPSKAEKGLEMLEEFLDVGDLRSLDLDHLPPVVERNSFHTQIARGTTPPVFLIHGAADGLVPVTQSLGLCAAYGDLRFENADEFSLAYACGARGSELRIIGQAGHMLDLCADTKLIKLCTGGDKGSLASIVDALQEGRAWLATNDGPRTCSGCRAPNGSCVPPVVWYRDADGDGFGDPTQTQSSCSPPAGFVSAPAADCCDRDSNAHPGQTSYFGVANACGSWDYDCSSTTGFALQCAGATDCGCVSRGTCSVGQCGSQQRVVTQRGTPHPTYGCSRADLGCQMVTVQQTLQCR